MPLQDMSCSICLHFNRTGQAGGVGVCLPSCSQFGEMRMYKGLINIASDLNGPFYDLYPCVGSVKRIWHFSWVRNFFQ